MPGAGWAFGAAVVAFATVFRMLRWRVPGPLWLIGVALCTTIGHTQALLGPPAGGNDLLHDTAGLLWAVLAAATALAGLALGQSVGVDGGRISFSRSVTPSAMAVIAAVLLGLQGLLSGAGLPGALWATWMLTVAAATFVGGLRYDDTARHHAGRVLLGFVCVAGTIVMVFAIDHIVQGLAEAASVGLSPARQSLLQTETLYALSNVRKMGFIATLMATMVAGAASQGSLMPASDLRGSFTAILCMGGLGVFVLFEAWLILQ